jgi:hypothetical protein
VDTQDGDQDLVISLSEARRADGVNDKTASSVSQTYETLWLGQVDTNEGGGWQSTRGCETLQERLALRLAVRKPTGEMALGPRRRGSTRGYQTDKKCVMSALVLDRRVEASDMGGRNKKKSVLAGKQHTKISIFVSRKERTGPK